MADEEFCNIKRYAEDNHPRECPCGLSPNDFQEAIPPNPIDVDDKSSEVMLFKSSHEPRKSHHDALRFIRSHFKILAQKYHPDKNETNLGERCTDIMTTINKAFYKLVHELCFSGVTPDKVVHGEDIFTKINEYTVTCQHLNSFAVYGWKEHVKSWVEKLQIALGVKAKKPESRSKNLQFGSDTDSLYITVYENGTVFVQGIMAIQFSVSRLPGLLEEVLKEKVFPVQKFFSTKQKAALKHFTTNKQTVSGKAIQQSRNAENSRRSGSTSIFNLPEIHCMGDTSEIQIDGKQTPTRPNSGKLITQETNTKPWHETNEVEQLKEELREALTVIALLREELHEVKTANTKMEGEMSRISKENKQIMSTLGPRIGKIEKTINEGSSGKWPSHDTNNSGGNPGSNQQNRKPRDPVSDSKRKGFVSFDPKKCVVISSTATKVGLWMLKDDEIRRQVGRQCGRVIIDRITRCGKAAQNLMLQLASEAMVQQVTTKWDTDLFNGTNVRETRKEHNQNFWGVAKGVPSDISNTDLVQIVKTIKGTQAIRMIKNKEGNKVLLKTVKIKFESKSDLDEAITSGLTVDYLHLRVEEFTRRDDVVQCNKCKRYNHMQSICGRNETCDVCGEDHHTEEGETCNRPPKCVNCGGKHGSRDRGECPKYREIKEKLNNRNG